MENELEIIEKQNIRLLLGWRGKLYKFATIERKRDDSLEFFPSSHNKSTEPIEFGKTQLEQNKFNLNDIEKIQYSIHTLHLSLHPKKQVLHVRENYPGNIIHSRSIQWYPVTKAFNILQFYSLPIDLSEETVKKGLIIKVPDEYTDSIGMIVNLYPPKTTHVISYENMIDEVHGIWPNYQVHATFFLTNQRTPATLIWSEESFLHF